jgi:hypothetical protein
MEFKTFTEDRKTVDAVVRNLIVIGEAAVHVPEDICRKHLGQASTFVLKPSPVRSGGAGEPPPHAPTDPYVNLSIHTAPLIQPINNNQPSTLSYMNSSSHFWLTI